MEKIAIVGGGGFGRELKILIDDINNESKKFNLIGFYDDGIEKGNFLNGLPVLGTIKELSEIKNNINVVIGIGVPEIKNKIVTQLSENTFIKYPNLIHPRVLISKDEVYLGKGNVICAGNIITCNIQIEDFVTLNLSCTVGHDTRIGSFCSFMPAVNISGEVLIEKGVYVGTGAKIINQLEIGENTIIGAGAVVAKSLPANCTAVGIPAKPIKFHNS